MLLEVFQGIKWKFVVSRVLVNVLDGFRTFKGV